MRLSRSLLSGWVDACCQLLDEALQRYVLMDGKLHADAYDGFNELYREGYIKEAAVRRKIHDVHVRTPSEATTEALRRIGEIYGIEADIRGKSVAKRVAIRQEKTVPLLNALEGGREKQQTHSRLSELAKAFAYALNQWDALKYYASDGWAEPDNNIAENALRTVSLGRNNYLFFGSDHGGGRSALYGLIDTLSRYAHACGIRNLSLPRTEQPALRGWPFVSVSNKNTKLSSSDRSRRNGTSTSSILREKPT